MMQIIPYIAYVLMALAGGVLVNFVVEWFYIRRQFYSEESVKSLQNASWARILLWPFGIDGVPEFKPIRISFVNLVFMGIGLWLGFYPPEGVQFWWGFGLLIYFAVVVVMDLEYRVVLHPISYAGALIGFGFGVWSRGLVTTLLGGAVGFGSMYILYKLGEVFVRWMSKRRGEEIDEIALGFGDVNIAGVIGLMLGWPGIALGLFLAIMAGGLISLLYMMVMALLRRLEAFSAIPYAPFLVFGAIALLYFKVFLDGVFN